MRILVLLVIVGVLAAAGIAVFVLTSFKPQKEWVVEVKPSDQIVIKGPVGKTVSRPVGITCVSGENVRILLSVIGLAQAHVKPRSITLSEGETAKATLTVKISKLGEEEGRLRVRYGEKSSEVKVKVIGLPSPVPRGEGEGEEGGEEVGQQPGQQGGAPVHVEWLNFTILAEVTVEGEASGYLTDKPPTTYESSFVTTYVYAWMIHLVKQGPTSGGTLYTGYAELVEVSRACTERHYHQLTQMPEGRAEMNATLSGCINRLPEGQSLSTSIEAVIDAEGRIVQLHFGYPEWYLGEITGTETSMVQALGKTVTSSKSVTDDFWLSAYPIELLVSELKPQDRGRGARCGAHEHRGLPAFSRLLHLQPQRDASNHRRRDAEAGR